MNEFDKWFAQFQTSKLYEFLADNKPEDNEFLRSALFQAFNAGELAGLCAGREIAVETIKREFQTKSLPA